MTKKVKKANTFFAAVFINSFIINCYCSKKTHYFFSCYCNFKVQHINASIFYLVFFTFLFVCKLPFMIFSYSEIFYQIMHLTNPPSPSTMAIQSIIQDTKHIRMFITCNRFLFSIFLYINKCVIFRKLFVRNC